MNKKLFLTLAALALVAGGVQAALGESQDAGAQSGIFYPDKSFAGCEMAQYYNAKGVFVSAAYHRKDGYLTN